MEAILLQYGLPGVCILALGTALVRVHGLYAASIEKRIEEAGGYKVALLDVTNKLATLAEVIKAGQQAGNGK